MRKFLLVMVLGVMTSCSTVAVSLTPSEVKEVVVNATAIANVAEKDPPTGDDLLEYLRVNAELWRSLADFYGVLTEDK